MTWPAGQEDGGGTQVLTVRAPLPEPVVVRSRVVPGGHCGGLFLLGLAKGLLLSGTGVVTVLYVPLSFFTNTVPPVTFANQEPSPELNVLLIFPDGNPVIFTVPPGKSITVLPLALTYALALDAQAKTSIAPSRNSPVRRKDSAECSIAFFLEFIIFLLSVIFLIPISYVDPRYLIRVKWNDLWNKF